MTTRFVPVPAVEDEDVEAAVAGRVVAGVGRTAVVPALVPPAAVLELVVLSLRAAVDGVVEATDDLPVAVAALVDAPEERGPVVVVDPTGLLIGEEAAEVVVAAVALPAGVDGVVVVRRAAAEAAIEDTGGRVAVVVVVVVPPGAEGRATVREVAVVVVPAAGRTAPGRAVPLVPVAGGRTVPAARGAVTEARGPVAGGRAVAPAVVLVLPAVTGLVTPGRTAAVVAAVVALVGVAACW